MEVAVEDGGEFGDANFVAGLFAGFASSGDGGWFANIGPATGEGPAAILEFADEENTAILEGGDTHINFGGSIARLLGEEFLQTNGVLGRAIGHDFRRNGADLLVTLNIELIPAVGETALGDGLQAARPIEPWRNGHKNIFAVARSRNKSGR